jgi:hypothetical protein
MRPGQRVSCAPPIPARSTSPASARAPPSPTGSPAERARRSLAEILFTAPSFGGEGGLANTRTHVSELIVLAALLASYDRWWPRAVQRGEVPAPPERPLPVLAFASTRLGHAWVERVRDSARAYGGPEATVRELRDYGHLDVLVSRTAARDVYGPIVGWLGRAGR